MLDAQLLESYIENFYGYGSWDAPLMFIGPEEGGGEDELEILSKLKARADMADELGDLKVMHLGLSESCQRWFIKGGKIQPTWGKLCRIALAYFSPEDTDAITADDVRAYQMDRFGCVVAGETCVIEASSLPCPAISKWKYDQFSDINYLQSRISFESHFSTKILPQRLARIERALSAKHDGGRRVAIVYGRKAISARLVEELTGKSTFDSRLIVNNTPIDIYDQDAFALLWIAHPVAHGLKSDYFHQVGIEAARLAKS